MHRPGGIKLAAHAIETLQQSLAVGKSIHRDAPQHHILTRRTHGSKGGQGRSEKTGARLVVRTMCAGIAQTNERRRGRINHALEFRHRGAELWPTAGGSRLAWMMSVENLTGIVLALVADQRADYDQLFHDPRQPGKRFADLDARDIRRNRLPGPGNFFRRLRLQIKHILMGRSSHQIDQDH